MTSASLSRWLLVGEWRAHVAQVLVALIAIAIGVAMAYSIHLINTAAFNEFSAASKHLSGQADMQVRGRKAYFDESLYPWLANQKDVAVANPMLELDVAVVGKQSIRSDQKLKILGIDMFRAAQISPDLLGLPAQGKTLDRLASDTIFLSPAAMEWLQVQQDDELQVYAGLHTLTLRVAGGLVRARAGQRLAVMDIGAMQWRFEQLGLLSRIELKLQPGVNHHAFKARLAEELGSSYWVTEAADQELRVENMSRAYRINLNMLALVALFTGAFLVFSAQALSVIRRRQQFALLRVLGVTRVQLLRQMITEGIFLGALGSLLGLSLGYLIAVMAIQFLDGNLGSSFFPGVKPGIFFDPIAAMLFFGIGLCVTLIGSIVPAMEAARTRPALALRAGSEHAVIEKLASPWPALICLGGALLFTQLPPILELPVFGYLAIMLLLIGGIALMPRFTAGFFSFLTARLHRYQIGAVSALVLARLTNAPSQAAMALGGILASFSLMVAMAIMVMSFRVSIDHWLGQVLPADLYVRVATTGDQGGFQVTQQQDIAGLAGIERVDLFRTQQLILDASRPEITLFARPIDGNDPRNTLPLTDDVIASGSLPEGVMPMWVSEAMVDLYGYRVGERVQFPVGASFHEFVVVGIWRDYGRQFGAVQIQLADYQRLSGDLSINTAAIWLRHGMTVDTAIEDMRRLDFGSALEISRSSDMRALSLKIFDRSFAVTYVLETVAVIIGLLGVGASFSAQTLARAKEFGMLRHVGMTRRQILAMLAAEGGLLTALGTTLGFVLGWSISLILIFIVNPQSFHWTMQLYVPWSWLLAVALLMLISAALTALMAGRQAVSGQVIRAVKEDW
ncbi:ABC transporter permease [Nitrosomonas sp. JL21]|uniref:FtsX-like permease family protein n=1 Tax=Nitrosomonas sp. JL21 TaxID=153949 RepID=UPI0013714FBA|nr:ABC transporter permease [Nitrosomonas sp. JL21]MBL8498696.1 ABC transporter permease [Nitrosomonas sp.]MXS77469.1 ABC transporter permease [Nitrosomonas sp. JL21]